MNECPQSKVLIVSFDGLGTAAELGQFCLMDATVVPISLILWARSASDTSDPPVETSAPRVSADVLLSVRWVFKAVLTAAGVVYSWRVDRGVSAELRNNSNLILQVSVSHVWWTLARYKQTHLQWWVRPVSWQQFTKQLQVSSAAVCCGGCKQAVGMWVAADGCGRGSFFRHYSIKCS